MLLLTYGSDVWGVNKIGARKVDKMFNWVMRYTLKVKSNTNTNILGGECGIFPPSLM